MVSEGGRIVPESVDDTFWMHPTTGNPYLLWFTRRHSWAVRMAAAPTWRTQLRVIWPERVRTYLAHVWRAVLGRECPGDEW